MKCCITYLFKRELIANSFQAEKSHPSFIKDTVHNLLLSLNLLKSNCPWSINYPIHIFYDKIGLSEIEKELILEEFSNVKFHIFPSIINSSISLEIVHDEMNKMKKKGLAQRDIGYRRMCNWYAYDLWRHPEIKTYDYVMRLDTDSLILSELSTDLFKEIQKANIDYIYRIAQEADYFTMEFFKFINSKIIIPKKLNVDLLKFNISSLSSLNKVLKGFNKLDDKKNFPYVFNNFFVAKASLFREGRSFEYLKTIINSGNIFYKRWGDANIHSVILALINAKVENCSNISNFVYGKWGMKWALHTERRKDARKINYEEFEANVSSSCINKFEEEKSKKIKKIVFTIKNSMDIKSHQNSTISKNISLRTKERVDLANNYYEQIKLKNAINSLKGKFYGCEAVILSCGPSLKNDYSDYDIAQFCKGKLVIAVKEALFEANFANLWFLNDSRWREYDLNFENVLTIYTHGIHNTALKAKDSKIIYDVSIPEEFDNKNISLNEQLIHLKNFSKYNFSNQIERPWGPGILYETVFYMLLHMKISNVYTLGWDLSLSGNLNHYFDEYKEENYKESINNYFRDLKSFKSGWDEEMKNVIKATESIYSYFNSMGLNIYCLSKQSYISEVIPRISI